MKDELDKAWEERKRIREDTGLGGTQCRYGTQYAGPASSTWTELGNRKWYDAVYKALGPVEMEWPGDGSCIVGGIMVFLPEKEY